MVRKQPPKGRYVAYLRVSTQKQGQSGLGLEAQRAAVRSHFASEGIDAGRVKEFVEVESGKNDDRPVLTEALDYCAATNAILVIAKLDRLSRDAHFLLGLQKSGVPFVAADMPQANKMTVGIMALIAQNEREAISKRTKEALQAVKAKIEKAGSYKSRAGNKIKRLGNPNGATALLKAGKGNKAALAVIKARADADAQKLRKTIEAIRKRGVTSAYGIARELNELGCTTPKGSSFTAKAVQRVLARIGKNLIDTKRVVK
jgi:DNA invertase Pin-like site-specific DNA recombinase